MNISLSDAIHPFTTLFGRQLYMHIICFWPLNYDITITFHSLFVVTTFTIMNYFQSMRLIRVKYLRLKLSRFNSIKSMC